jgi:hypothetical protein
MPSTCYITTKKETLSVVLSIFYNWKFKVKCQEFFMFLLYKIKIKVLGLIMIEYNKKNYINWFQFEIIFEKKKLRFVIVYVCKYQS